MLNALNPTEGVVLERRQRFTFKQQNQDTKKEKEENLNIDPIAMAIKSEGFLSY